MADVNFWFPSQTGSYNTPAGDLRILITYDDTSGSNTDIDAPLVDISPLKIPLSDVPGSADVAFTELEATFYNLDNVFETESIIDTDHETETFIVIYLGGSVFWRGLIDMSLVNKSDYYYDSGLKYREITIKAFDALRYFWVNDVDRGDITYTDDMLLSAFIGNIFAEVGIAAVDVNHDTQIYFTEQCGNIYAYPTQFYLYGVPSSMLIRDFLKQIMIGLNCFIFNLNGDGYVVRRRSGTSLTVQTADIIEASKSKNIKLGYVSLSGTKDWAQWTKLGSLGSGYSEVLTYTHDAGDSDTELDKVEITELAAIGYIFTEMSGDDNLDAAYADSATATSLTDSSETFLTDDVEAGMQVHLNYDSGDPDNDYMATIIHDITQTVLTYAETEVQLNTIYPYQYRVYRKPYDWGASTQVNRIFKIYKILEYAAADLYAFFNRFETLNLKLYGISTYGLVHRKYSFNSQNWRVKYAEIDFMLNVVELKLLQVA